MTQNAPLAVGDPAVEAFFDATQEMLSGAAINFALALLNPTTVRVAAGIGHDQVSLSVEGQYRYVTAPVDRAFPGGAAGAYDIYATAAANDPVTHAPPDYAFALAIVAGGGLPVGVGVYRRVGALAWDGAAITRLTQTITASATYGAGLLAARPAAGQPGREYRATDTGQLFKDHGTGWFEVGCAVGDLKASARVAPPEGWAPCDGAALSRTGASALFAAIGTTYGIGDGAATFNVPDCRGRAMVGLGTNAAVNALGDNEGAAIADRQPRHSHTVASENMNAGPTPATYDVNDRPASGQSPARVGGFHFGWGAVLDGPVDGPAFLVVNWFIKL